MKIYTKKGDSGETGLLGGTRVPKDHLRISAYGTMDELNSFIGALRASKDGKILEKELLIIQDNLFTMGSHLANDPDKSQFTLPELKEDGIEILEKSIDQMESQLPPLKNFLLPGDSPENALAHICRCVCRRAERETVSLSHQYPVNPVIIKFLNRLSDYLFVSARFISLKQGVQETLWKPS